METIDKTKRIAELNDELRRALPPGQVFVTANLNALGPIFVAGVIQQVRAFDDFNEDNDPDGEHDFGSFEFGGQTVNWKIDSYDHSMKWASPDPADPKVTKRILTIMLAMDW